MRIQDVFSKVSSSRFPFGSGKGQCFEGILWLVVESHGNQTHGVLHVIDDDGWNLNLIICFRHIKRNGQIRQKFTFEIESLGKKEGTVCHLTTIIRELMKCQVLMRRIKIGAINDDVSEILILF